MGSGAGGGRSGEWAQFALMCGVSDDVIHVSITSGSPTNAVPPHFGHGVTGDDSSGSTGSSSSVASTTSPQPSQYQTGNGTP